MLIRSQNKRFLVNIENIDCIGISDSDVEAEISAFNGEVDTLLGFYSTGEKAMEVLDKIQEAYESHYPHFSVKVFQMPTDSEVR